MPDLSLILTFLAIGFAATIKGAIGFGLPVVAVPVVANILDPRTAVVVLSLPVLLSNLLILVRGGGTSMGWRRLGALTAGLLVGTTAGALLLASLDLSSLALLVGSVSVGFVALNLARVNMALPPRGEGYFTPLVGLISGALGGTTNMFGPILTPYLYTLRLAKREFVFSITLLFSIGGVVQVLNYVQLGLYSGSTLLYSLLTSIPVVLGTYLGLFLQDRISAKMWNRIVLTVIFISGLNLILRGLQG